MVHFCINCNKKVTATNLFLYTERRLCVYFKKILIFLPVLFCVAAHAQVIDNTTTFRTINSDKYRSFHYDNDFFGNADYYYTQGINAEYVHPKLKALPFTFLLIKLYNSNLKYGIGVDLYGYTPTSIRSDSILHFNRPYAGAISAKQFLIAVDTIHHGKIVSSFTIGVIGPAALGNEIQTTIHRTLGKQLPNGWKYQVKNDLIINYTAAYEKRLVQWKNNFLLNAKGEVRAGTINTKANTALNFMAGHFKDPYQSSSYQLLHKKKFSYYLFGQSEINFVGYDASLQGGLLNKKSVYTIAANQLKRITYQQTAGIAFSINNVYLSYYKSWLTSEFAGGKRHAWGGIGVGVAL